MQLTVSPEVLLSQLSYTKSEAALKQAETMIASTKNFDKFAKHIIALNDSLKIMNGYVALSNSTNFLKIKCDETSLSNEIAKQFHKKVLAWADKYNVKLEKLNDKNVYYMIGVEN